MVGSIAISHENVDLSDTKNLDIGKISYESGSPMPIDLIIRPQHDVAGTISTEHDAPLDRPVAEEVALLKLDTNVGPDQEDARLDDSMQTEC